MILDKFEAEWSRRLLPRDWRYETAREAYQAGIDNPDKDYAAFIGREPDRWVAGIPLWHEGVAGYSTHDRTREWYELAQAV